jgi:hypothetical protein
VAEGGTLTIGNNATLTVSSGADFTNKRVGVSTGVKNTSTMDPDGFYAIGSSGVYYVNPVRGSVCRIWVHTTAYAFIRGSNTDVRFPTSKMRCLKVACTTKDQKRWGAGFALYGFSTARAYVGGLAGFSSDAHDTHLIMIETSST